MTATYEDLIPECADCGWTKDHHPGCPAYRSPRESVEAPSLPYAGTQGHSGSETSRERAVGEAADGTAAKRQKWVLRLLARNGGTGLTVKEVREHGSLHHGQASSVLSVLHRDGKVRRLTHRRDRCQVYVLPEYVMGREEAPHRTNKTLQERLAEAWEEGLASGEYNFETGEVEATVPNPYKKEQQ